MRSFQFVFWILFLLFYFLVNLGAYKSVSLTIVKKIKKRFQAIFLSYSASIIVVMILLYIWPYNIRESNNYAVYFFFNAFLFIDLFSKIPLALSYLPGLLLRKRNQVTLSWMGLIISICVALLMLQGLFIGKNRVLTKHVDLEYSNLPENFKNYKILHVSDIHLGSFVYSKQVLNNLYKKAQEINPDLLLMTGDLINNFSYEADDWSKTFKWMNNNVKSFSILGNHDYGNYSNWKNETEKNENFNKLIHIQEQFGFQLLRNENTFISKGKDTIYLIGVENWGHPPFPQYADLEKALIGVPENAFKILMTHDPAHWQSQIKGKKDIDLTLSGHTHGLQWGIKPGGIPFSLSYFVRKNWGGLYKQNNSYLYVNTGLSTVGVPWRIDMPAEITVYTLK